MADTAVLPADLDMAPFQAPRSSPSNAALAQPPADIELPDAPPAAPPTADVKEVVTTADEERGVADDEVITDAHKGEVVVEEQNQKQEQEQEQEAVEQAESSKEEEAGVVTEGSDKVAPADAAKGDGAGVEKSDKKRGRPGRPKREKDGDVEEDAKTPKPSRTKAEKKEVVASFSADRPTRERKSIDRFIASAEKDKNKELHIKQGGGTALKDIPNVAYKLSKRYKHDETLSQLHSVLFNKRGKAAVLKQHILQFSGYVWGDNEDKERAKVQEKLERYTKESLVQFVDVLDIHVSRTLKKEDLVAKVLEFLEKPLKTTDTLLEHKEQERKSSGKRSSSGKGPGRPKLQRVEGKSSRKRERKKTAEDGGSDESEKGSDNESLEEEIEQKRLTFKEGSDHEEESMEDEKKQVKNFSTITKQDTEENVPEEEGGRERVESTPSRKKSKVDSHDNKTPAKSVDRVYSKKKVKEESTKDTPSATPAKKGPGRPKKSLETSGKKDAKSSPKEKEQGKKSAGKGSKQKKKKIPSDEELQAKIRELLKEADFSKVTFTDVVSQLEDIFGVSLTEQKGHVKGLIRDEISKLTEGDEESEEEDVAVETAKDEKDEKDEKKQVSAETEGLESEKETIQPAASSGGDQE